LKALTQTDKANIEQIERLIVRCPNGGKEQILYGHRLVKVTVDKSSSRTAA
jgi:hypothetical protein